MYPNPVTYHIKEWLHFWYENQMDTYGEQTSLWSSPHELAEVWYAEEEPDCDDEEDKKGTVWFSAGVFLGEKQE